MLVSASKQFLVLWLDTSIAISLQSLVLVLPFCLLFLDCSALFSSDLSDPLVRLDAAVSLLNSMDQADDTAVKVAIEELMKWCVGVGGVEHHHIYLWGLSREHKGSPRLPKPVAELLATELAARE